MFHVSMDGADTVHLHDGDKVMDPSSQINVHAI